MFRRQFRRGNGDFAPRSEPAAEIARANQLLAAGQPEQAAVLFVQLAGQMERMGRPRQAANLHAQAAHAWAEAGVEPRALNQARLALAIFNHLGMPRRAAVFKENFLIHLHERAFYETAKSFEHEAGTMNLPPTGALIEAKHGKLPAVCPHCGAPLRSDWVEWVDEQSAVCDYCSSTVHIIE
jgi:hypothetical protein